jgi:MoaA/NifB/PqqE/SkfB family radical SAM enzyme
MNRQDPTLTSLPILILFPHNRCNCRCVMCDIWKVTEAEEISAAELERHTEDLDELGVHWVVFSGGEPLMHSDLFRLARLLTGRGIRTTLLTTGLLLPDYARQVVEGLNDVIVSLDGPPEVHDRIRRVPNAYDRLAEGVRALHSLHREYPVSARCTVQNANYQHLRPTVETARALGLDSISFLAADLTSGAFHRGVGWPPARQSEVALDREQVVTFESELEALIGEHAAEIEDGFVREGPEKLRRMVRHFRAHLGLEEPIAPRCNAPWVSAVVETDGVLRPCFFHQPIGNVRKQGLRQALNSPEAIAFRKSLDVSTNPVCRRCTCSLYWDTPT